MKVFTGIIFSDFFDLHFLFLKINFKTSVMSGVIQVTKILAPPSRLEGGGFEIKDIMSGLSTEEQDPFLVDISS